MDELEKTLLKINEFNLTSETKAANLGIRRLKYRLKKEKSNSKINTINAKIKEKNRELSEIKKNYIFNPKETVSNLKKLKWVDTLAFTNGRLVVITKDIIMKTRRKMRTNNFGPYKIEFPDLENRPRLIEVTRVLGAAYSKINGGAYHHPVISGPVICLGDHNHIFALLMKSGRIDSAMAVVWVALTKISDAPFIDEKYFASLIPNVKRRHKK